MDSALQGYIKQGVAASTRRSYAAGAKRFHEFCEAANLYNPFPLTEKVLCYFATYLASQGLTSQSVRVYLAAVRDLHITMGFSDLRDQSSLPLLKRVQSGIQRVQACKKRASKRVRLPITPHLLSLLHSHWESTVHPERQVLWAVAVLCFAGFFRLGELLQSPDSSSVLSWGDVSIDNRDDPSVIRVYLRFSKCDQYGRGVKVYVGQCVSPWLCPVAAVTSYMASRGPKPGPFFQLGSGRTLTKLGFVSELRRALLACGIDQAAYSGHSFRIGAATAAAEAGLQDSTIQMLGRWSSAAFLSYIRTPGSQLAAFTSSLLRS